MRNIFVIGLDRPQRQRLARLPRAGEYRFHPLLRYEQLQRGPSVPIEALIDEARRTLAAFDGHIDAIVSYWDFPGTLLVPVLATPLDLPGPCLEAMLKCEHKYWSRCEQRRVVGEVCPPYQALDPYDLHASERLALSYPCWIKPVKAYSSQLSYRTTCKAEMEACLVTVRQRLPRFGEPFNHLLKLARLPEEIARVDGMHCIAEADVRGAAQCTIEGFLHAGRLHAYGVIDSHCYPGSSAFLCYEYPSRLPDAVQVRIARVSETVMRAIGFEGWPFNIEYFWSPGDDRLSLLEINPRISRSHAYIFEQVDGVSNNEVMIELALGRLPRMPHRAGPHRCAAKFMLRTFRDGVVRRTPSPLELQRAAAAFPEGRFEPTVREGDRLSRLPGQDSYSYLLAEIMLAAESPDALMGRYRRCVQLLPFEIEQLDGHVRRVNADEPAQAVDLPHPAAA